MLHVDLEVLELPLRDPFVIAGDGKRSDRATTVILEIRDDRYPGLSGIGEGFPLAYYGETADTVRAVVPMLLEAVAEPDLTVPGLEAAAAAMARAIRHHGAARCAIDIALHDLAARVAGLPLPAFLGLEGGPARPTDFTLGLDHPEIVAERARRAGAFPALKVKVGGPQDMATLRAVREVFEGPIRIDANTGWDLATALAVLPELADLGVELIEQPFPAHRIDLMARLQEATPIPIVADESVLTSDDLDGLVGLVRGVNIKLGKCGGVGPARRMLERARALGFQTFLGCMQETSVGIAAAAVLTPLADWVDLDGSLLLAADPFEGLSLAPDARWILPEGPGLGVRRHHGTEAGDRTDDGRLQVKGLVWAGVRTDQAQAMRAFVRDVLGAPVLLDERPLTIFRLPDTSLFEVLWEDWRDEVGYPDGPVLGFWVDDVDRARAILADGGVEIVGQTYEEGPHRWQHFRAPDGNLYQVASGPYVLPDPVGE